MKRILSALMALVMLFGVCLGLTSCGEEDYGAEISVYLTDRIYHFDPAGEYTDDASVSVLYLLYEPLFLLDDDGDIQEGMAEDYDYDEDTGVLTVTLRESYWNSGERVVAEDFVFAWQRILNPANGFACAPLLYDIKNAVTIKNGSGDKEQCDPANLGVAAYNASTLQITFESKDTDVDAFLRNLTNIALAPVNRYSVNQCSEYWMSGSTEACFTNGPLCISDLDNEAGYFTLSRNDGYHRPEDSKKDADHYVVPKMLRTVWNLDEAVTEAQHSEQFLDLLGTKAENTVFYMSALSLADRKEMAEDAVVSDALSTYSYVFDTTNPLFSNPAVRVVLSQVIDRQAIIDAITFGAPATGFIGNGVWDSTSSRAKKSFRSVGGELLSANKVLTVDQANTKLNELGATRGSFTLTYMDREEDKAIAEIVSALWEQLGYTVNLKPVSYYVVKKDTGAKDDRNQPIFNEYKVPAIQSIYDGDFAPQTGETLGFDVIGIDYQMFSTNALTALASFTSNMNGYGVDYAAYNASTDPEKKVEDFIRGNRSGYANAEYDALIAAAAAKTDLKERAALLHQAEEMLLRDMPVIPLV
ncbi:MAG: hypothetical protein IJC29_02435, partial [Clostridia bacterium]|nr:hypothetical protein [Clostridia bacterium]